MDRSEHIFLWLVGISIAALLMHDLQRRNKITAQALDPINKLIAPKPQNDQPDAIAKLYAAPPIGNVIPLVGKLATGAMAVNGGFGDGFGE